MDEHSVPKYSFCNITSFKQHNTPPSGSRQIISIVVPAYNEEANIAAFYDAIIPTLDKLDCQWEILFVDDGSHDSTLTQLDKLAQIDPRVKYISFSRNFGNQMAITAGLEAAIGDAVIVMDADLQQPPDMIPVLLDHWKNGYHVVNTIRNYGQEIGLVKKFTSAMFYHVMNLLSDVQIQPGVSDFRLMDRKVVNILNNMPEHSRFIRAQIAWLGFRQTTIPYQCNERHAGTPSFSTRKLITLALDGIFSFSIKPLRWIALLGLALMGSLFPYGVWALFQYFVLGPTTPGWTSLFMVNLFLGGTILLSLGIIGEYIGRIYDEVKHRPRYIVRQSANLEEAENQAEDRIPSISTGYSSQSKMEDDSQESVQNHIPDNFNSVSATPITRNTSPQRKRA